MPIKVYHTNKKDTNVYIQAKIDDQTGEAVSLNVGPNHFFYSMSEFVTQSMRLMERKEFIRIEKVDEIPPKFQPYKVYSQLRSSAALKKEDDSASKVFEAFDKLKKEIKTSILDEAEKYVEEYRNAENLNKKVEETKEIEAKKEESKEEENQNKNDNEDEGYVTGNWTKEEKTYLLKTYPKKGAKYVAKKLNRKLSSVQKKVEYLRLKKIKKQ